mmetsp:Transcript_12229/g.25311  ORF Transcript_12229/g.25311 Transcript_12229/m.25311 type:complete len:115 (+) Transcript_12229:1355-1699(+)
MSRRKRLLLLLLVVEEDMVEMVSVVLSRAHGLMGQMNRMTPLMMARKERIRSIELIPYPRVSSSFNVCMTTTRARALLFRWVLDARYAKDDRSVDQFSCHLNSLLCIERDIGCR